MRRITLLRSPDNTFYIVIVALMAVLIIDLLIGNVADIYSEQIKSIGGMAIFYAISAVSIAGQLYLLRKLRREGSIGSDHLRKAVWITQYVLIAIIILAILQIIFGSFYLTNLLSLSTAISYGLTIVLMGILMWQFLIWFKRSKNLALLLYASAAGAITINGILSITLFDAILMEKPQMVTPKSEVIFNLGFESGTSKSTVVTVQAYSYSAYIILIWGGTIMVLHHNIQRIGKVKFWALVPLPLIYFVSYDIALYQELYPDSTVTQAISENFAIPIIIGTVASTVCGILFGLSFLLIARSVSSTSHIREYMLITGFGFMLFINAATATVLQAAYPPFGLANVSFVGLAAYLILFGLYRSALSIAHDVKLRQLVKSSLVRDSNFLKSIGDAQMMQELENKVLDITKKNSDVLEEKSGKEPSMTNEELRNYIYYIMNEYGKKEVSSFR
jgi:hypothetical protein